MHSSQTTSLGAGLGFRLDRLVRGLRSAWASELTELALAPPQAAAVRGVAGAEGTSVRALARQLGGDPMNVKRCVDDLERRGPVTSTSDPDDRRPRLLSLTDRGLDAAVEVDRRVASYDAWLTRSFSQDERARFEAGLTKLEAEVGVAGAAESRPAGVRTGPGAGDRHPPAARSATASTRHHSRQHEEHR